MNNNKTLGKRMFTLSSILLIGVLLLTACSGSGGINITGGGSGQSGGAQGIDQTTLILIVVGVVVLVVIALARRK